MNSLKESGQYAEESVNQPFVMNQSVEQGILTISAVLLIVLL